MWQAKVSPHALGRFQPVHVFSMHARGAPRRFMWPPRGACCTQAETARDNTFRTCLGSSTHGSPRVLGLREERRRASIASVETPSCFCASGASLFLSLSGPRVPSWSIRSMWFKLSGIQTGRRRVLGPATAVGLTSTPLMVKEETLARYAHFRIRRWGSGSPTSDSAQRRTHSPQKIRS